MKTSVKRSAALFLALITIVMLASCTVGVTKKPFTRGTIKVNEYTSEFLDFKFTAPLNWSFYTDEQINTQLGVAKELFDSEYYDSLAEGDFIDFMCSSKDGRDNINLSFSKGSAFVNVDKSLEASISGIMKQYDSLGWTSSAGDARTVTIAERDYRFVTLTVNAGAAKMKQYIYGAMVNNYFVTITATSATGKSASYFEAMFSKASA